MGSGQVFVRNTLRDSSFIEMGYFTVPPRNAVRGFGVLDRNLKDHVSLKTKPKWAYKPIIKKDTVLGYSSSSFFYFLLPQGEAKVFALLEGLDSVPEDAEVFVVLEGSTLVHVTRAQNDVMLCFIVPGMSMCKYAVLLSVCFHVLWSVLLWQSKDLSLSMIFITPEISESITHAFTHAHTQTLTVSTEWLP